MIDITKSHEGGPLEETKTAAAVSGQKPLKKVEVEETKGDDLKQLLNFSVDSLTTH